MRTTSLQRISVAVLLAILCSAPTRARALDGPADPMSKSSELYQKARALQQRGQWAEAEALYQAAWDIRKTFDIGGNLGDCELHVRQPREAAEHLSYALRNMPAGVTAEQKAALADRLQQAQRQIGTVRVTVNVTGAQLFVDGRPIDDASSNTIFVNPGTRTIEARLAGYESAQRTLTVGAGAAEDIQLTLAPPRRSLVPGIVLGSVAGVALASGIGVFVVGRSKGSSAGTVHDAILAAHHSCVTGAANFDPKCNDLNSTASTANTFEKAGVGLLVGAGAAAVGTVIYFVLPSSSPGAPASGALRVAPTVSSSTAGLVFSGAF